MTTKKCTICKSPKLLNEFNNKKSSSDGKQNCCRECNRKESKKYYAAHTAHHKFEIKKKNKAQRISNKQYLYDYTKSKGCIDCGENDPCCLDFDHVRGEKIESISVMINNRNSLQSILKEIDKCEVRCANCHRKKTAKDFGWYKSINTGS